MTDNRSYLNIHDHIELFHHNEPENYTISGFLGSGGSAACYAAQNSDGVRLILKEFNPVLHNPADTSGQEFSVMRNPKNELVFSEEVTTHFLYEVKKERFRRSFQVATNLSARDSLNEHIASPFRQLNDRHGNIYQVIAYNTGFSMREFYRKDAGGSYQFSAEHFFISLKNAADAVASLHAEEKVHLDIKPGNIYIGSSYDTVKFIDTDSILSLENGMLPEKEVSWLSWSEGYSAPELFKGRKYRSLIGKASDIYSVGACLFVWLFGKTFDCGADKIESFADSVEDILEKKGLFSVVRRRKNQEDVLRLITGLLNHSLQKNVFQRYRSMEQMAEDLQKISDIIHLEKLQTENKNANFTFAVYYMLQKYPLFRYISAARENENGTQALRIGITGTHPLREEVLSGLLCMQMLHIRPEIYIIAKDAKIFWENYISDSRNAGLKDAVIWDVNGKYLTPDAQYFDPGLVQRELAVIHVVTECENEVKYLENRDCGYYIFLHKKYRRNISGVKKLDRSYKKAGKICVSYLDDSGKIGIQNNRIDLHYIGEDAFNEEYNEEMYRTELYRMGLMVHYYYCGYMDIDTPLNAREIEKDYKSSLYNMLSSQRAGLHSIYKIASLGIEKNNPGWIYRFYSLMQDKNGQALKQLSWLEHLSWTAFMLTKQTRPVSMEDFEKYAYTGDNDWKIRREGILYHPLLVASDISGESGGPAGKELPGKELTGKETFDSLDRRSDEISAWYYRQSDRCRELLFFYLDAVAAHAQELSLDYEKTCRDIQKAGTCLIDGMQKKESDKRKLLSDWQRVMADADTVMHRDAAVYSIFEKIKDTMRIISDAYKERDYKKYDRNLCLAIPDILTQ